MSFGYSSNSLLSTEHQYSFYPDFLFTDDGTIHSGHVHFYDVLYGFGICRNREL